MTIIPEYKRKPKEKPKTKKDTTRTILGVSALVASILLSMGYLLIAYTIMALAGLGIESLINNLGAMAPLSLYLIYIAPFIQAALLVILALTILYAGIRGLTGSPGSTIRSGAIAWGLLLTVYLLTVLLGYLGLPQDMKDQYQLPLSTTITALLATVIFTAGAVLVKARTSFTRYFSGAILLLIAVVMLIMSATPTGGGVTSALQEAVKPPAQLQDVRNLGRLNEMVLLLDPYVLIGLVFGAIAVVIAPFLGVRNLWISAIMAAMGSIFALSILLYYSAVLVNPLWTAWNKVSHAELSGVAHPLIIKSVILSYLAAALLYTIGALVGLISAVIALSYYIQRGEKLFQEETGQGQGSKEPASKQDTMPEGSEQSNSTEAGSESNHRE
ncbi:MAG: hypothetical protein GSR73_03330 [Desulfurococcales archaeon]|nr:hypothetical protein [Desulfurococcales archaeon]